MSRKTTLASFLMLLFILTTFVTPTVGGTLNVTDFGAVPNDTGDDLTAINNCIASSSMGDRVFFPAGTYRISGSVMATKPGIGIEGDAAGESALLYVGSALEDMIVLWNVTNVTISHLTLDGNNSALVKQGINSGNASGLRLENLTIRNIGDSPSWGPHAIIFCADVTDSAILNNRIENIATGTENGVGIRLAWRSSRNLVADNVIANTGRGGIQANDDCTDLRILRNTVTGSGHAGLGIELWKGCHRGIVEDNQIDHWFSIDSSDMCAVRRNTISDKSGEYKLCGIEWVGSRNGVIVDNLVDDGASQGISLSGSIAKEYALFARNTVLSCGSLNAQLMGEEGGCAYLYFYKNMFKYANADQPPALFSGMGDGFRFNGYCRNLSFDSNEFSYNEADGIRAIPADSSDLNQMSFTNNIIINNTNGSVWDGFGSDLEWEGNTVYGNMWNNQLSSRGFSNQKPTAGFTCPDTVQPGEVVLFTNTSSDSDGSIAHALWDFGDGMPSTDTNPTHTYSKVGLYAVSLVVWDDGGRGKLATKTITVDAAPSVTIDKALGQADPTSSSPVNFTVVFSESVSDFATGDVVLSGTAGATTATVTGSGTTYDVAVSGMTGSGTVVAAVAAGVAHDAANNPNEASTSTDNSVTYIDPGIPPTNVSLAPSVGTLGTNATTFQGVYRDLNGSSDIRKAYLLLNNSLGQANSALVMYDSAVNMIYLKNDINNSWGRGYVPGTDNTLQNSQCYVYMKDSSVSKSGNDLTVNFRIALKSPFTDKALNGYMYVQDAASLTDGWEQMGLYHNVKPQVVSIDPAGPPMEASITKTLRSVYRDPNGAADIRKCYLLLNDTTLQSGAMLLWYDCAANKIYLKNTANTSWGNGYPPGTNVTLTNEQCSVYVKDTTVTKAGNDLTIAWSFSLTTTFAQKNLYSYMYAADSKGLYDGWKKMGTHFTPLAPVCASVTPSTGKVTTAVPQVFNTVYSDGNGYNNIWQCYLQIGQTGSLAGTICVLYDAQQNKAFLRDDGNTTWGTGYAPGTNVTVENGQCILSVKDTTVTPSGSDNLMIDWKITLKSNQIGKLLGERMYCRDDEWLNSAWKLKGYVRGQ